MIQDELTKESYVTLFPDSFQLTHYAIQLAQKQIKGGNEELSVTQLLREVRRHPPKLETPSE